MIRPLHVLHEVAEYREALKRLEASNADLLAALKDAVLKTDEDVIRVRPSDRAALLESLTQWNAAIAKAEGLS